MPRRSISLRWPWTNQGKGLKQFHSADNESLNPIFLHCSISLYITMLGQNWGIRRLGPIIIIHWLVPPNSVYWSNFNSILMRAQTHSLSYHIAKLNLIFIQHRWRFQSGHQGLQPILLIRLSDRFTLLLLFFLVFSNNQYSDSKGKDRLKWKATEWALLKKLNLLVKEKVSFDTRQSAHVMLEAKTRKPKTCSQTNVKEKTTQTVS